MAKHRLQGDCIPLGGTGSFGGGVKQVLRGAVLGVGLLVAGAQAMAMAEEFYGDSFGAAGETGADAMDFPPEDYSPYVNRTPPGNVQGEWLPPGAQGVPGVAPPVVTPTVPGTGIWPGLTLPGWLGWGTGLLPGVDPLLGTGAWPLTVPGLLYPFIW